MNKSISLSSSPCNSITTITLSHSPPSPANAQCNTAGHSAHLLARAGRARADHEQSVGAADKPLSFVHIMPGHTERSPVRAGDPGGRSFVGQLHAAWPDKPLSAAPFV